MRPERRRRPCQGAPALRSTITNTPEDSPLLDLLTDSMRRARSLNLLLRDDRVPFEDPAVRRALARTADRVACDLAKIERDLALQGMAA